MLRVQKSLASAVKEEVAEPKDSAVPELSAEVVKAEEAVQAAVAEAKEEVKEEPKVEALVEAVAAAAEDIKEDVEAATKEADAQEEAKDLTKQAEEGLKGLEEVVADAPSKLDAMLEGEAPKTPTCNLFGMCGL